MRKPSDKIDTLLRRLGLLAAAALLSCGGSQAAGPEAATAATETGGGERAAAGGSAGANGERQPLPPRVAEIVTAPDRSESDRALDAGREPGQLLAFLGVEPGMRVAEIGAGTGYTAELLARAVAPGGTVYGVNSPWVLERFAEGPWASRLQTPAMKNAVRLDREFDDPFPAELSGLDLVCSVLVYHDFFWMEVDRAAMNAAVFRALRPGGSYVIIDHAAEPGSGARDVRSLHRVDPDTVRREVERAGFRFVAEADFLRNPDDARDWNAAPSAAAERRGMSDRFALKFVKP